MNHGHRRVPLQRIGERQEIAAASLFLCSDEASYVNGAGGRWRLGGGLFHEGAGAPASL